MLRPIQAIRFVTLTCLATIVAGPAANAHPDGTTEIIRKSRAGLQELYSTTPAAGRLGDSATAVLVFPSIVKAGFVGSYGG